MLSKKYRLTSSSDIKKVLANGKSTRSGFLFLKISPNQLSITRFAFSIGVGFSKSAVKRNAMKRKLRAAVAKNLELIKPGYDCLFYTRKQAAGAKDISTEQLVNNCLQTLNLLKNK